MLQLSGCSFPYSSEHVISRHSVAWLFSFFIYVLAYFAVISCVYVSHFFSEVFSIFCSQKYTSFTDHYVTKTRLFYFKNQAPFLAQDRPSFFLKNILLLNTYKHIRCMNTLAILHYLGIISIPTHLWPTHT